MHAAMRDQGSTSIEKHLLVAGASGRTVNLNATLIHAEEMHT